MDNNKNECSVVFLPDGTITSVYRDDVFDKNGKLLVRRVTNVEFDNEQQKWVAKLVKTGEIIATGDRRDDVLKEEVKIIQEMLFQGKDIRPNEL